MFSFWFLKLVVKVIFSRIPIGYTFWRKIKLFKHGNMENPKYAHEVFKKNFFAVEKHKKLNDFVFLELGVGDSLFSAMIGKCYGASKSYLVDVGDFASKDIEPYLSMQKYLSQQGFSVPELSGKESLNNILGMYNSEYLVDGLNSLKKIPSNSIDYIFSNAVLEHIKREDFFSVSSELKRILKNDGVSSHIIDFKDHLGGALNNLRFSESLWESEFMSKSGFYTNRLQCRDIIASLKKLSFICHTESIHRWNDMPTPISSLNEKFSLVPENELLIKDIHLTLTALET